MAGAKDDSYRVGPGKPPREHQFRPGTSGNPSGRPKQVQTIAATMAKLLDADRTILIDGQRTTMPNKELLLMKMLGEAQTGNIAAFKAILPLIQQSEALNRPSHRPDTRQVTFELTDAELALVGAIQDELGRYLVPAPE